MLPRQPYLRQQWLAGITSPLAGVALVGLLDRHVPWSRLVFWYALLVVASFFWIGSFRRLWLRPSAPSTLQDTLTASFHSLAWGSAVFLPDNRNLAAFAMVLMFLALITALHTVLSIADSARFLAVHVPIGALAVVGTMRQITPSRPLLALTLAGFWCGLAALHRHVNQMVHRVLTAATSAEKMQSRATTMNRALLAANEDLRYQAGHDQLTGLPNRGTLMETLTRQIEMIRSRQEGIAVLYIDIDHFKAVNDEHGHAAGDRVLGLIARRLQGAIRPGDLVARLGGDEMACVLPGVTMEESQALALRLLERATAPIHIDQREVAVGLSIGLCWTNDTAMDPADTLRRADQALYQAKKAGRNRIAVATPVQAED